MYKKNDIATIPFERLPKDIKARTKGLIEKYSASSPEINYYKIAVGELLSSFVTTYDIGDKYSWIMPQMVAHFGSWTPIKNEAGLYDGKLTIESIEDDKSKGLWYVAQWLRSNLIKGTQLYKVPEYNNLVPLILKAFKLYQNIPYSKWSRENLEYIVDEELCKAMLCTLPKLSNEEILEIRTDCLKYREGSKSGQDRDPATTAMLYGIKDYKKYDLKHIPKYGLIMMTQIWCAHPSNRGPDQVLDPSDWDHMPSPLLDTAVLLKNGPLGMKNLPSSVRLGAKSPWDA